MNLPKITNSLAALSVLSFITTKSVLSLSKYKDYDIGNIVKLTISNLTKDDKKNDQ